MSELKGQPTHPVVPVDSTKHPDNSQSKPDAPQPPPGQTGPGQAGPVTGRPDVQQYMHLDKQTPETPVPPPTPAPPPALTPTHVGAPDAQQLQTPPGAAPDGHVPGAHTPDVHTPEVQGHDAGHQPEAKPDAGAPHTDAGHTASGHTDAAHAAPGHAADAHGSTTAATAGHAQDQGSASGARDAKPGVPEAPESALARDVRTHLQPFGVTPEQAQDYMRTVLGPSPHLDPAFRGMPPAELQRVGDAVSHLPAPLLDHVVEQAKGVNAQPGAASQTLDTGKVVEGARQFGFGHSLLTPGATDSAGLPKIPLFSPPPPVIVPPSVHQPQFFQPTPKQGEPSEFEKKTAEHAATGAPTHRTPDTPDASKVEQGDYGKLLQLLNEASGVSKLTSFLEANVSHLPAKLAHDPAGFAFALGTAAAIAGTAFGADVHSQRPAAPGPSTSDRSPIGQFGAQLTDAHLGQWGGVQALNAVLGLLGNHPKISVDASRSGVGFSLEGEF